MTQKSVYLGIVALMAIGFTNCQSTPKGKDILLLPPGYECQAKHGLAHGSASLEINGGISGASFSVDKDKDLIGFSIIGSFNQTFLADNTSGWGGISVWPPVREWVKWEHKVSLEVLRPFEGGSKIIESAPPRKFTGSLFLSRRWGDLRNLTNGVEALTFKIRDPDGKAIYKEEFNTTYFRTVDQDIRIVAAVLNDKIKNFKAQCTYYENRPNDEIIILGNRRKRIQ